MNETEHLLSALSNNQSINTNLSPCPAEPVDLIGPIGIDIEYESLASIEQRFHDRLEPGGYYKPNDCKQLNNRVAIVIPYRDRTKHLPIFFKKYPSIFDETTG